jgi:hypothetical protein
MEKFREQFKKEKDFTYWAEGCNYGSFNDDYVNWLEKKLALTLTDVGNCKLNTYHIETQDTTGRFNFFTSAKNHKKALKQLLKNSSDYKNIVKANRDLKITIKRIDKPT